MQVSNESHPVLFGALIALDRAMGADHRDAPDLTTITIPAPWDAKADAAEAMLDQAALTDQDLVVFLEGDEDEIAELAEAKGLQGVNDLFDAFFVAWREDRGHS